MILDPWLWVALKRDIGDTSEPGLLREYQMTKKEVEKKIELYRQGNEDTFQCHVCNKDLPYTSKCRLSKCVKGCIYQLCRDCFIYRITGEEKNSRTKQNGSLKCPFCHKKSRAIFYLTHKYCSSSNPLDLL